ncbi:MAG: cupredoxin domain-containing protein [Bryobacteraceae bacterium]
MKNVFWLALLTVMVSSLNGEDSTKPVRTISIVAERFFFSPSKIKLKEGETVEFVLTSDDTDHGFHVPSAGIDVAIPPSGKGEARIRFTATKKGSFRFECSRACGAGHNLMRGEIVVK